MAISKELETRLKRLEDEQTQQEQDVTDLREIEKELENLETQLNQAAREEVHHRSKLSKILEKEFGGEETDKLEKALAEMDAGMPPSVVQKTPKSSQQSSKPSVSTQPASTPSKRPKVGIERRTGGELKGYVIRLMFDEKMPTEWSEEGGGGWRTYGKGRYYKTLEEAYVVFKKLTKQWPDYPIQIIKSE